LDAVKIALQLLSKSIKPAFVYEICERWAWKGSKCVCIKKQVELVHIHPLYHANHLNSCHVVV